MRTNRLICIFLILLLSFVGYSQVATSGKRAPTFSSVYTDLSTECRNITEEDEAGERKKLTKCRGYGGYNLYIRNSTWSSDLEIRGDLNGPVAEQRPGYWSEKGRKVEWRLADGKPFALIFRVSDYKTDKQPTEMKNGETPFDEKYKTGESLRVEGLAGEGIEKIRYKIDVKTPDANERAREMADNVFLSTPTLAERRAAAERSWPSFFKAFRSAVARRDRAALKEMLTPSLTAYDGNVTLNADEAIKLLDDPGVHAWEAFDKILAEGTAPMGPRRWYSRYQRELIDRIAPPAANFERNFKRGVIKWYATFSFSYGQWKCDSFIKCCPLGD